MATHKNAITTWGEIQVITSPQPYNIEGNYTPVNYTFQIVRTATSFGGYWSNNTSTAKLTINGTPITVPNFTYDFRTNYTKVLVAGTINIPHEPDGKKTFAITASTTTADSLPNGSLSANETLTTIPRASSIGTISGNYIGSPITVNISRTNNSFTHYVYYQLPGQSWQQVSTNATTSSTFTIPGSGISFLPNATNGQLRIMIRTYSGGTRVGGDITKNHTVHIPTSTFTAPSSFTVGSAFTASINRVGSLTHTLSVHDGSTDLYWTDNNVTTSVSPNISANTLIARMSGVISKTFTVRVDTYNGSTYIGTTTKNITATIPASTFTAPWSFTVGSSFTVSINRVGSLTHVLSLHDGSTAMYWGGTITTTSGSVDAAADTLIARMSGVISKTFTVRVDTYNGSTYIGTQTRNITATIPKSVVSINHDSRFLGQSLRITTNRASTHLFHVVKYNIGYDVHAIDNGAGDYVDWVVPNVIASYGHTTLDRSIRIICETYNGGVFVGSSTVDFTSIIPDTVEFRPSFGSISVSENVISVASLVGAYVQTRSKLNLAITGASGKYGTTIKSYNITGLGHNVNSSSTVTDYLSVSGNQTITGTITDSRGLTFSKSIVINILPYTPPTLSGLSFRRTLPDKTDAPLGDNATVRASVKVHSLIVNGVQKNSIKYQVQSAESGGSFTTKANTTSTDLTKSYSDVWVGYSVDHSYNFRVRVGDVFGFGGWSVGVVPTGVVTQQWGSKTTSFGKMIDNTSYNVQVGTGGIQSDGPIIDKNGNEVFRHVDYVIDYGETLSGWFYKYASGRLVCFSKAGSWGNSVRTQVGSLYRWNAYAPDREGGTTNRWFYPHPFVNTNVLVTGESTDTTFAFIKAAGTTAVSTGTLYAYKSDEWVEWTNRNMVLKAEGRWK